MAIEGDSNRIFEGCIFTQIFRTFRMAIQPSKLLIAFGALVAICLVGWVMDLGGTVAVSPQEGNMTELMSYLNNPKAVDEFIEKYEDKPGTGVFATMWNFGQEKFKGVVGSLVVLDFSNVRFHVYEYLRSLSWALKYHPVYCVIFFLIKLAIISVAGGAICRMAALQFAQGEKPGFLPSLKFSLGRFLSFFTAPLAPIGIMIFIGLFIVLLGLIGNIPYVGELLIALFFILALIAGVLIALIFIGTVAGFNLMFPAIAYEGLDCFDAISRVFNYVYTRPWKMAFYTGAAVVYGAICYFFVRIFAYLILMSTYVFLRFPIFTETNEGANKLKSIWPKPEFDPLLGSGALDITRPWTQDLAGFVVQLLVLIVVGLVISFIISFYFSANTIIYALLRNVVDKTGLDEVYRESRPEPEELEAGGEEQSRQTQPQDESEEKQDQEDSATGKDK